MAARRHLLLAVAAGLACHNSVDAVEQCPGQIDVRGFGAVQIRTTALNVEDERGTRVEVARGEVRPHLGGRSYWANSCQAGPPEPSEYVALRLLGRRVRYTTDVSGAGCGCNAAFYLTPMWKNTEIGACDDYYCDAQSVCGVACAEIDVQENNRFAWASTLHAEDDHWGKAVGYGGGGQSWSGPRDFNQTHYGPAGACVDTDFPFQVSVSFPMADDGWLSAMVIELSQAGKHCQVAMHLSGYDGNSSKWSEGSRHGMKQMTEVLSSGVTPIISYWGSEDMLWMDGKGEDGKGPCRRDLTFPCSEAVSFYNFSVEDLAAAQPTPAPPTPGPPLSAPSPGSETAQAPTPARARFEAGPAVLGLASAAIVVAGAAGGWWLWQVRRRSQPLLGVE